MAAATAILDWVYGKPSITQIDDSVAHEIKAFEVVAVAQRSAEVVAVCTTLKTRHACGVFS